MNDGMELDGMKWETMQRNEVKWIEIESNEWNTEMNVMIITYGVLGRLALITDQCEFLHLAACCSAPTNTSTATFGVWSSSRITRRRYFGLVHGWCSACAKFVKRVVLHSRVAFPARARRQRNKSVRKRERERERERET